MDVHQVLRSGPPFSTILVRMFSGGWADASQLHAELMIIHYSRFTTADVQPQAFNPTADGAAS
jgi:hypothetical protein